MNGRPNLFQFWHAHPPPSEVAGLVDGWRGDPGFRHRLFDAGDAEDYVARALGERARAAFARCAVPAMQADVFRLCALWAEGGAYLDADGQNEGGLALALAEAPTGVLVRRRGVVINGFLFVRRPGHALFARAIDRAVANIEGRVSQNVWEVTGPGVLTELYDDPATRPLFDGFDVRPIEALRGAFTWVQGLHYKTTEADWRAAVYFPTSGRTIYRDD